MKKGFTLIELLIVIAIIAILAAIAVPNFLEAQVRAKVSRVRADQRSLATGLESYRIDNNSYPPWVCGGTGCSPQANWLSGSMMGSANGFAGRETGAAKIHTHRVWTTGNPTANQMRNAAERFFMLTSPVAHVNAFFADPFADTRGATYGYYATRNGFILYSFGPDSDENGEYPGQIDPNVEKETVYSDSVAQPSITLKVGSGQSVGGYGTGAFTYDPSNGTGSAGDVYRVKS